MSFPRYPAYKDSGVEWLGEVPEHWELSKIKHVLSEMGSGGTPDTAEDEFWTDSRDGVPWVAIGDMSERDFVDSTSKSLTQAGIESKRLTVWPTGTLLFSMYASLGHVSVLRIPATTNQAILALVPGASIKQSFLVRWFQFLKPHLAESASSNTQDNLNAEKVRNLIAVVPPANEQVEIATFLDRETAKIDALVAEQRRLMELLKEKRRAVISQAVTRGLNLNAPLKPSGIEWLGDVPEHWEVNRYKNALSIFQGMAFKSSDYIDYSATINVRMGNIKKGGFINLEHNVKYLPDTFAESYSEYVLRENDLIIAMTDMSPSLEFLAVPAILKDLDPECVYLLNQRVGKLTVKSRYHQGYIKFLMLSDGMRDQLKYLGLGTVQSNMSSEDLYCAFYAAPPLQEQIEIVSFLADATKSLDTLTAEAQRAIDLLQERRTALISAAVTGQIDVRGAIQEM